MTTIAGIAHRDFIVLGSDQRCSTNNDMLPFIHAPKIEQVGPVWMAAAGSLVAIDRVRQSIRRYVEGQELYKKDSLKQIATTASQYVRSFLNTEKKNENPCDFILAHPYDGVVLTYWDGAVAQVVEVEPFAIGSGAAYALGAMYSCQREWECYKEKWDGSDFEHEKLKVMVCSGIAAACKYDLNSGGVCQLQLIDRKGYKSL